MNQQPNKHIYHTITEQFVNIKAYKFSRLAFCNKSFWNIWCSREFPDKSTNRLLYTLATAMSLSRFTRIEMNLMLIGWLTKHHKNSYYPALNSIIEAVDNFTLETRRAHKREEMRQYRLKKRLKEVSAPVVSE